MVIKPKSRVGFVLFGIEDGTILLDCKSIGKVEQMVEVREFGTSIVINNTEIVWSGQNHPVDVVVLMDNRPEASALHSVLKGTSGEIERFSLDYTKGGVFGVFFLRYQPERHPIFTQGWRFSYNLPKRRVVVQSNKEKGIFCRTY